MILAILCIVVLFIHWQGIYNLARDWKGGEWLQKLK